MKKTANATEVAIVKRILEGDAYADISADTGVAVSTIKKIKKRNYERFFTSDIAAKFTIYEEMRIIISRTNQQILRRLDAEENNMSISELLAILDSVDKRTAIKPPPISS